ncbi:NAD(P)/FAD-dependent oxidoreductase [Nevskia sp.]|uniref:NAD(P)/FAD-dependent oxidoreductase n=1 Tax=Nevskia sp. TaxID=1929292 RepID=UPI003F72992D
MTDIIDSDYLVIGAGGMGMAFVDELITQTTATVTIVDRNHRPGGHWNDAYPFVRLHQTSTCYGVNSTPLGNATIDQVGWNKGCYELASGSEVVAYFDQVMRQRFLPSGRVRYLPMCDYRDDGRVVSRLGGAEYAVRAGKIVDATYINVTVPSQRPPKFQVLDGAVCVPPNAVPKLAPDYSRFTVVGSGKTGIDTCLFLLEMGVAPADITWVMPNDAWLFDRFTVNPGRRFTDIITAGRIEVLKAAIAADSVDDFFRRVLACDQLFQFDPKVKPTNWRCATVTRLELEQLRRIPNVVRLGHVQAVTPTEMRLDQGTRKTAAHTLYIDCAADGLKHRPVRKVFDGNRITLQTVRMCQQVYSAGFIGNVEANLSDEARKNALCRPVPLPHAADDYLRCAIQDSENMLVWLTEPKVVSWINASRIDLFSPIFKFDCPVVGPQIEAMGALLQQAIPKMQALLDQETARA